jgi:hypothetical protein
MARSDGGASPQRAATKERRRQPPLLPRARRVASIFALAGVARLAEIAADIGTAFAPWPARKLTATRPTAVFQQSPKEYQWLSEARNTSLVLLIDDLIDHFPMHDIWTFMIKGGISIIPGVIWI